MGRRDPRVAQVALDPASTPIIDLNAATFQAGGSPNRISLADLLHNDGAWQPHSLSFYTVALPQLAAKFPPSLNLMCSDSAYLHVELECCCISCLVPALSPWSSLPTFWGKPLDAYDLRGPSGTRNHSVHVNEYWNILKCQSCLSMMSNLLHRRPAALH